VNFLHSGYYRAMFQICAENNVDNKDVFVIAEQCLLRVKALLASHTTPPMSGLRGTVSGYSRDS